MNPKVSIIMGVYNEEKTIETCIDSIIAQTYQNWEFIICDDCSTDKTNKIIQNYADKDSRIVLIRNEKNMRLAASLNNCLKLAKGEYVARMDADDIALPERLKKQVDFLNKHPEYAVVGSAVKVFDGEKVLFERRSKSKPTKNDVLYGPTFMHPTVMMRKFVYDDLGGYTISERTMRGQDWDLWFRFYAKGYRGYNLDEALLLYHESPEDYKKRTLKTAKGYTKTALMGYKLLGVSKTKYIFAFKPMISVIVPEYLKRKLRKEI
ncbi:MAG: glycosyltransferase family A protein [Erysipelotrichia bacterium]|nr:glycosyltransferase family A protein [Erysipelotrichia bacterium]